MIQVAWVVNDCRWDKKLNSDIEMNTNVVLTDLQKLGYKIINVQYRHNTVENERFDNKYNKREFDGRYGDNCTYDVYSTMITYDDLK